MPLLDSEIELIKSKNPAVIKLSFVDRAFIDADALVLVSLLNDNPYIETIDLGKNNISDEGAKALADLRYVKSIDLSYNNINEGLCVLVANHTICDLCLDCNNVQTKSLQKVLRQNLAHLHMLSLAKNPFQESLFEKVQQKISRDKIEEGGDEEMKSSAVSSCCML